MLAIDARRDVNGWDVCVNGGRLSAGRDALEWAMECARRGAGEILLTSMDADGTQKGYDVDLLRTVSEAVPIPVIASGGAGNLSDFVAAVTEGRADAVLAASLFHYGRLTVAQVKEAMAAEGIAVRREATG